MDKTNSFKCSSVSHTSSSIFFCSFTVTIHKTKKNWQHFYLGHNLDHFLPIELLMVFSWALLPVQGHAHEIPVVPVGGQLSWDMLVTGINWDQLLTGTSCNWHQLGPVSSQLGPVDTS